MATTENLKARLESLRQSVKHLEHALRFGDGLPTSTRNDLRSRLLDQKAELTLLERTKA